MTQKKTDYAGIDYGLGRTNIGEEGIRFGVIPSHDVGQAWYDSSEPDYGDPHCPECGADAIHGEGKSKVLPDGAGVQVWTEHTAGREDYKPYRKHGCCGHYACDTCKILFDGEDAFPDESNGSTLDDGEYKATEGQDSDIFILKAPYFTYAQFCSPCAPGACYLRNELETPVDNNRAYCFGHDWFEGGKAPYRVYSVETGKEVIPQAQG